MKFRKAEIKTTEENLDRIQAELYSAGMTSYEIKDPREAETFRKASPVHKWDYVDEGLFDENEYAVIIYPDDTVDIDDIISAVGSLGEVSVTEVDDSDWKDKWKEYFKVTRVGKRLVIKPSWEKYDGGPDDLVINIDPGIAFGTGTHETTTGCMLLLEKYLKDGGEVLDVGSGSGILTAASLLLGARHVTAVDIDEDAVEATCGNLERNGLEDRADVIQGDLTDRVTGTYDIVVANLMADLIVDLSADIRRFMKKDGLFISSGILLEKEETVIQALKDNGFIIEDITEKGEWCAIAAR